VDRTAGTIGWALGVTLLQPTGGYPAGVTILVNPVNQYLSEVDPSSGAGLSGTAYGTRVQADVGDEIQVISDPTARVGTPYGSSNGKTLTNSTLGVKIPGLLTTGVVTSTTTSTKDAFGNAEITNTNQTAGINLLGGLIKANAIKVTAYGKMQDGVWTSSMKMDLVNLVIAGKTIPINVSPNTIINVAGLGEVAINLQRKHPDGAALNRIDGIRITLSTAQAGLPVGAVIELG
ncbi:choice-of-anchor P family protein, partial [Nocardioides sp. GCM10030258]|uniref:choice-of-anchor P family protein n=1 Tax=unclassified Nocardioides TaxID=2615069 RepID=UPI00361B2F57